ncbi:MAG TPA: gamma-glutamylcyclotransferase family protein [Thermoanaerobaculia bacterium]|nr:gamma-glutamylcyclotransferase family protein [Thermoanaerobaculia bacterium]
MPARIDLFVYGTLLRGEPNHGHLAGGRFLRETATGSGFALVDLGPYPGMIKAGGGCVAGELYRVGAETLAALDALEQHPEVYWRTAIRLVDRDPAQSYLLRPEHAAGHPLVPGGDWRAHRARREASANMPRSFGETS